MMFGGHPKCSNCGGRVLSGHNYRLDKTLPTGVAHVDCENQEASEPGPEARRIKLSTGGKL